MLIKNESVLAKRPRMVGNQAINKIGYRKLNNGKIIKSVDE